MFYLRFHLLLCVEDAYSVNKVHNSIGNSYKPNYVEVRVHLLLVNNTIYN